MRTVFVDTETVRLSSVPGRVTVWEIAIIVGTDRYLWKVAHSRGIEQPTALEVGRYHQRYRHLWTAETGAAWRIIHPIKPAVIAGAEPDEALSEPHEFATELADLTRGCQIAGSNPWFDMDHITTMLMRANVPPAWHFHPLDIPSMAEGACAVWGLDPVSGNGDGIIRSSDWSRAIGVDPDLFDRHTALGDAEWCRAQYQLIYGGVRG